MRESLPVEPERKTRRFVKVEKDLLRRTDLSLSAKMVLSVVRDRMGGNDHSWPGVRCIARDIGLTPKPVMRAIKELELSGLLKVARRSGQSNRYRLTGGGEAPPVEKLHQSRKFTGGGGEAPPVVVEKLPLNETQSDQLNETHHTGDPDDPTGHVIDGVRYGLFDDQGAEPVGQMENASPPKPARKPRSNRPRADTWELAEEAMTGPALKTKEFARAWAEWAQYRRESGKPLTPSTIRKQIKELESHGHDGAISSIHRSIQNGWQGLFRASGDQRRSDSERRPRLDERIEVPIL